ncbi:MAG: NAD(P)/FAD-dependent oxidoreductase [Anaerovoracaceae bacterium]
MKENQIYDVIIIGGGAAGLFCAAAYGKKVTGLILEKTRETGKKLLMSGSGQCNLTHGGDIKDFLGHYGENGKKIRKILYGFSNKAAMEFFEQNGIPLFEREDGKIFPKSLKARDVRDLLLKRAQNNGFEVKYGSSAEKIEKEENIYRIVCGGEKEDREYLSKKLVVASGGCSYPSTGSDGKLLEVLREMGISIVETRPSIAGIFVQEYPFGELSGISFSPAEITVYCEKGQKKKRNCDDLLLTHSGFSGPGAANLARYVRPGDVFEINYLPGMSFDGVFADMKKKVAKNSKQITNFLLEYCGNRVPKRFIESICCRSGIGESRKASSLSGQEIKTIAEFLCRDTFSVSGTEGFQRAMATAGGVSLEEIKTSDMESKQYPGMYFIGEVLDIDGDTGGYNLQFAWSSGYAAGNKNIF